MMKCYIKEVEIINYKSIQKVVVQPNEELSVFIGKNGSGKTVFLNAIQILDKLLSRSFHWGRERRHLPEGQENEFSEIRFIFYIEGTEVTYYAKFNEIESDHFRGDELDVEEEYVSIKGFKRGKKLLIPLAFIFESFSTTSRSRHYHYQVVYKTGRFDSTLHKDLDSLGKYKNQLESLRNFVTGMKYYSATKFSSPSKCPNVLEFDEKGSSVNKFYSRSSSQHEKFLSDLYLLSVNDNEAYEIYLKTVGPSVLDLIDGIKFSDLDLPSYSYKVSRKGKIVQSESKRKIVVPIFCRGRFELSPMNLSEGTFKTLALIFYILTDQGALFLVEEPEVCVHHGLLAKTIDIIKSYSYEKQVFLTTHSEAVLDSVEPESVFVVTWDDGSQINRLNNFLGRKGLSSLKKYLKDEGNLGEYIKHKDILNE